MNKPLYKGTEWTIDLLHELWATIEKINAEKYGLTYYEPQVEIVTADQMLYHHSMHAMPISYSHWSFGKQYIDSEKLYREGKTGIAFETIINTDPMICYIMEDNSATMQATVLAHANVGHGSFFKNNYLFKKWTDASSIVDYLVFAKKYISKCEEKYGADQVETFLDACHSLWYFGIDKYKRRRHESPSVLEQKRQQWMKYEQEVTDEFWDEIFKPPPQEEEMEEMGYDWPFPEENLLYFMEKNAPHMPQWKREILRIVRKHAQYFYPQIQTKLMNEGWASFWHYTLMTDLYDEGYIDEGSYMEFLDSHCGVVNQWGLSDLVNQNMMDPCCNSVLTQLPGLNPYALGFAMFQDIKRACENPDEEDYETMPLCAGQPWLPTMKYIMANFKDENFVLEFLSPKVIKKLQLCCVEDDQDNNYYEVKAIQNKTDYREIRRYLSKQYSFTQLLPQVEVVGFDATKDRTLYLRHTMLEGRALEKEMEKATLKYVRRMWGYPVQFESVREDGSLNNRTKRTHE